MESKRTILVIEDEPHIALGLKDALEFEGFLVFVAENGKAGKELAQREHPDAILLDLMLPDMNGYDVCRDVRARDHFVPIIMLTAKSQETDKIRGLEAGADDYVTKPFGVGELVARIRAIFRRARRPSAAPIFKLGEATINIGAHTLTRDGKRPETLSFYEVELLRFLHERSGQPVSRDELLDKIWGLEASPSNRTIDNFVVKLRKKLEKHPEKPEHILTVYGFGYKLVV